MTELVPITRPDPRAIELARELLAAAERGEVQSLVWAYADRAGNAQWAWHYPTGKGFELAGVLSLMSHNLAHDLAPLRIKLT